jgi:hypothetical protein
MGDAIHDNVASLPAGLQLVAGYVTGTPDIQWTAADWARFPGIPHVTIDQGYQSPPVTTATVRDVEAGAWTVSSAVDRTNWTAARQTIYCDQATLPGVLQAGWQGDLWLAIVGWQPGQSLPAAPGCTVVAVQNQQNVGSLYDLSVVLDPTWPYAAGPAQENDMPVIMYLPTGTYLLSGGKMHHVVDSTSAAIYEGAGFPILHGITDAEGTALLADFPPGNPAVTVNTTGPAYTITGTATPQ